MCDEMRAVLSSRLGLLLNEHELKKFVMDNFSKIEIHQAVIYPEIPDNSNENEENSVKDFDGEMEIEVKKNTLVVNGVQTKVKNSPKLTLKGNHKYSIKICEYSFVPDLLSLRIWANFYVYLPNSYLVFWGAIDYSPEKLSLEDIRSLNSSVEGLLKLKKIHLTLNREIPFLFSTKDYDNLIDLLNIGVKKLSKEVFDILKKN